MQNTAMRARMKPPINTEVASSFCPVGILSIYHLISNIRDTVDKTLLIHQNHQFPGWFFQKNMVDSKVLFVIKAKVIDNKVQFSAVTKSVPLEGNFKLTLQIILHALQGVNHVFLVCYNAL